MILLGEIKRYDDNDVSYTGDSVNEGSKPTEKKQCERISCEKEEKSQPNVSNNCKSDNVKNVVYKNPIIIKDSFVNYNNYNIINKCCCNDNGNGSGEGYQKCIPVPAYHNPKQPLDYKLKVLEKDAKVPSVLGAYFIKLVKRYLENKTPQDELETEVFSILDEKYSDMKDLFRCGIGNFEKIASDIRNKIFDERLVSSEYVDLDTLTNWFAGEVEQLYAMEIGSTNSECPTDGIAGLLRPESGIDNEPELFPRIFYLNNLRTSGYRPVLDAFDYTPEEILYECTSTGCHPVIKDASETVEGDYINIDESAGKLCLEVPAVERGDNVVLKGMNFIDTSPQVRVKMPIPNPDTPEYVYLDGHVCGDTKTPVYETINGQQSVIADSRVSDVLTFKVPDSFTEGEYEFQVIFENNTEIGVLDQITTSPLYFQVLPPSDTTFKIELDRIDCNDTTDGEWGSDEVALKIVAIPYFQDGTAGSKIITKVELSDVDAPYTASFNGTKVIYSSNKLAQLSVIFLGHEIDSEEAYENQIRGFFDCLNDIVLDSIYAKVVDKAILLIKQIPVYGEIIGEIAEAISYVVYILVACWAPADLIIQETLNLSWQDLARATSQYYPMPAEENTEQDGNIVVTRKPVRKSSNSYVETRIHNSRDEGSHYDLTLIYSRI